MHACFLEILQRGRGHGRLVFAHLGPGNWQPRTGLGWQIEHFLGYFVVTSIVCLAWPRPFVVGAALMAAAVLLEGLQALTPDRPANFLAALYGAGGALAAALLAELFIRAWRWRAPLKTLKIIGGLVLLLLRFYRSCRGNCVRIPASRVLLNTWPPTPLPVRY